MYCLQLGVAGFILGRVIDIVTGLHKEYSDPIAVSLEDPDSTTPVRLGFALMHAILQPNKYAICSLTVSIGHCCSFATGPPPVHPRPADQGAVMYRPRVQ